jgi:hypothetical protein
MNVGDHVQFNITQSGAFCCLTNASNFTPALPAGLLPVGIWPNTKEYPLGAQATVAGDVAYSFSTSNVNCAGQSPKDIVGKIIHVGSGRAEQK